MPSFYFEQVLQTALTGIDQNVTGPVLQVAGTILILSLLYAVYEAYSNGGDVRALGIAGIKYLVLGLVFLNYQQAFRSVNGMFNGVADYIYNTNGIGDVIQNWLNSVSAYISQQGLSSFWTLVTGAISGLLDVLLILVGLIILPVSYTLREATGGEISLFAAGGHDLLRDSSVLVQSVDRGAGLPIASRGRSRTGHQ